MSNSVEDKDRCHELSKNYTNTEDIEEHLLGLKVEKYVFRLYVAANSPKSLRAIQKFTAICEEYIPECYELEVIDIHEHPELLEKEQIFAVPTLIKELPPPLQRLIGDMTDTEKVIVSLDL